MEEIDHPYLEGVKCRGDGAVFIPASGTHKAHWTFGTLVKGYRQVVTFGRHYSVHRLICEAFHGLCPPDKCQVDHINRDKSDNRPENLHWVVPSENQRNRKVCDESLAKYGVSQVDDARTYRRALYTNNSEYREKCKASYRERWRNDPEFRERQKACNRRWRAKKKVMEASNVGS